MLSDARVSVCTQCLDVVHLMKHVLRFLVSDSVYRDRKGLNSVLCIIFYSAASTLNTCPPPLNGFNFDFVVMMVRCS